MRAVADRRYLIVGASGFIGRALARRIGPERAVSTYLRNPVPGGVVFDAVRMDVRDVLPPDNSVTHAFILMGPTNIEDCARDPDGAQRLAVERTKLLVSRLVDAGIIPVLASTDAVYDGERGHYSERDPPTPVLTYGRHKVELERHLSSCCGAGLIARFSKVVGADPGTHSLLGEWLLAFEKPEPIRCAYDQAFSPIDVRDVAEGLVRLVERGRSGLYHVAGSERYTRLELCVMLADAAREVRRRVARIVPCSIRSFDFAEPRPLDTSLDPTRFLVDTGLELVPMQTLCRELVR